MKDLVTQEVIEKCGKCVTVCMCECGLWVSCYSFVHFEPSMVCPCTFLCIYPRMHKCASRWAYMLCESVCVRVCMSACVCVCMSACGCVAVCCRAPVAAVWHPCVLCHLLCSLRGTHAMVPATVEPFTNTRLPLSGTPHQESTLFQDSYRIILLPRPDVVLLFSYFCMSFLT